MISTRHSTSIWRSYYSSKRASRKRSEALQQWTLSGVSGHIDLVVTGSPHLNVSSHTYSPYTTIQSIPNNLAPYKIGEIGYNRPVLASFSESNGPDAHLLNAKPFGWGTKFWMLKSHDVDCYAGSEFASNYSANSTSGTDYPVTLRSPLGSDKQDGVFAHCATYDPNPSGSGMTLGAAPCGSISCAPLPKAEDSKPSFPNAFRNPDGTFAPKFFTTRPCNYLDPNCHVSQIFLYNAATGAVRPMYHTGRMKGVNRTWISSGQPSVGTHEPLMKRIEMFFRRGDMRTLPGWPDQDPTLVVVDPAFDAKNVSQVSISSTTSTTDGARVYATYAGSFSTAAFGSVVDAGSSMVVASASSRRASSSLAPNPSAATLASKNSPAVIVRPVWVVRPAATRRLDEP
ncbi:hypothetical protein FRC12_008380 [Ceratobasidium sp. 428]|nr:hypothetical protein FRC12_008380 [Ceratobasidium sp. 428]